jgi:hypothetical protein
MDEVMCTMRSSIIFSPHQTLLELSNQRIIDGGEI